MAAVAAVSIQVHTARAEHKDCMICESEGPPVPKTLSGEAKSMRERDVKVLPEPLSDNDFVHLSCHPGQPYHVHCLRGWVAKSAMCPYDRNLVNPVFPLKQVVVHRRSRRLFGNQSK